MTSTTDPPSTDDPVPLLDVYGGPDEPDPEWDKGIAQEVAETDWSQLAE